MVDFFKRKLNVLKESNGLRVNRALYVDDYLVSRDHATNRSLVNFSSNDYLGLASDLSLQTAFFNSLDIADKANWMSASSARPLTGTSLIHQELEMAIARDFSKHDDHNLKALLFNSGYHANSGILPALTDKNDLILADKLVHASIIDGLRLGKAKFMRFAHNDTEHLTSLLERYRNDYQRIWIVTESVFSMDGDIAPIKQLVQLKKRYETLLYVDEAHALGCYGLDGLGLCESLGLQQEVDMIVGVFGKAMAGVGAFAVGDEYLIDNLVNFARSWLFSTALPPLNVAWNLYVWMQLATFQQQRNQLQRLTHLFRQQLDNSDQLNLGETYIVPVMPSIDDSENTANINNVKSNNRLVVELSQYLEDVGFLALPIRYPTVKLGSERVRFSLTANIPEQKINDVVLAIKRFVEK